MPNHGSAYYQHTGGLPLASRVSLHVRRRMFALFIASFRPREETSVLDVGVTSDTAFAESNYFEHTYPYPHRIVCVGTEDGSHLEREFPGLRYRQVTSGQPLPFDDRSFDIVFSNAVVEHAGGAEAQRSFLAELCRVGRAFFVTTPNRWFPVEHHTGLPVVHYLPPRLFRRTIAKTRYGYWADERRLNILDARSFSRLFPAGSHPAIHRIRFGPFASNLVAIGRTKGETP
jgi:SAM-dependent methyltransferase